jgi:type IV pilus assembly protein PilN
MMDLERVLPAGVQVTSIEPSVTAEGDVNIRLRVSGDRELAVQLVRNLERSQRFLSPRLATETAQTPEQGRAMPVAATPGGVEFVILSGYNPLPLALKAMDDKAKQSEPAPAQAEMVQPAVHTHAKGKTAAGAGRPKKAAGAPKARGVKP